MSPTSLPCSSSTTSIDATLVGHSYGGRVITKAWPQVATSVRRMIYLDAHAPLGPDDALRGTWRRTQSTPTG